MPLPTSPYLHGQDGNVKVAGDGTAFVELEATSWSGNPHQRQSHTFVPFSSNGWQRAVAGNKGGQIQVTVKARTDQDIRAAARSLVEGNLLPTQLFEPGHAVPHEGNLLILNVEPRVVSNGEFEYQITGQTDGEWTYGAVEEPGP
jgi:hypothetical protein